MPISTKAIKNRIRSVQNMCKITKAMEMVAASKMKRAVERSLASRRYAELALELLVNIGSIEDLPGRHPLLPAKKTEMEVGGQAATKPRELLIVISSNRGLCGAYNVNIFKNLQEFARARGSETVSVVCIGRHAERAARKLRLGVVGSFIDFRENLSVEAVHGIARLAMDEFSSGRVSLVRVMYTNYISPISNKVVLQGLLPITPEHIQKMIEETGAERGGVAVRLAKQDYLFEPSIKKVLEVVLPALTEVELYQAILESQASEHSSRMVTMKNASDNAGSMVEELTLWFNKARQSAITQEIVEVAAGAAAISSG